MVAFNPILLLLQTQNFESVFTFQSLCMCVSLQNFKMEMLTAPQASSSAFGMVILYFLVILTGGEGEPFWDGGWRTWRSQESLHGIAKQLTGEGLGATPREFIPVYLQTVWTLPPLLFLLSSF